MASQPTATNVDNNTLATTLPGLNPSTLDTITELAHLLSRLRTPPAGGAPSTTTAAPTPTPAATAPTTAAPTAAAPTPSKPTPTPGDPSTSTNNNSELSLKDVPAAADALKHRFQRARAQIRSGLPDLGRGIAEQEAERAELERKIARQREVLARLRDVGVRFARQRGEEDEQDLEVTSAAAAARERGGEGKGEGDGDGDADPDRMVVGGV